MPEFINLLQPAEALRLFLERVQPLARYEKIPTMAALGRIIGKEIIAPHPLPSFVRSSVDGFAVIAKDTHGASASLPAYLQVVGEIKMGTAPDFLLRSSQCALIHTGGMLPRGANAVIMLEDTQRLTSSEVEIFRSIAVGENVLQQGEDIKTGDVIIGAGVDIRAAEIGGLLAFGIMGIEVASKPRIGILSSGDEIVPPERQITPGQVRDINSYTIGTLIEESGGIADYLGVVPDQSDVLFSATSQGLSTCDAVVITAGSSASARDLTSSVIKELGKPGILVHGINIRPGKPTILAICDGKPVIGLPGNPVSALVIATLFLKPAIRKMIGGRINRMQIWTTARLTLNIPSQAGREDWVPVQLLNNLSSSGPRYLAEPIFGKSNLIFSLVRADGLLHIGEDATGANSGDLVDVLLL